MEVQATREETVQVRVKGRQSEVDAENSHPYTTVSTSRCAPTYNALVEITRA